MVFFGSDGAVGAETGGSGSCRSQVDLVEEGARPEPGTRKTSRGQRLSRTGICRYKAFR